MGFTESLMASIGHVLVGVAAARFARVGSGTSWTRFLGALGWAGLALLPDADVVGFGFGVRYVDEWGHRGATHSFAFALALGVVVGLAAQRLRRAGLRTGAIAFAVVASHPVLDVLTDGGLGCALLWPFSDARFFAPWRPLPVAPIGGSFISPRGLYVACIESVVFLPFLVYALWPPRRRDSDD